VDGSKVPPGSGVSELAGLLDSPEIRRLVSELEETRWTGRPGYPIRAMVGMALVKSLYAIPTWSRTARLVAEHPALQVVLGCSPSVYACYRFTTKLRTFAPLLTECIARVVGRCTTPIRSLVGTWLLTAPTSRPMRTDSGS
jgi:hypothetical protein